MVRRPAALVGLAVLGLLAGAGCGATARPSTSAATSPSATTFSPTPPNAPSPAATLAPGCRADVKAGVHDPWRLLVVERCVTITGTVRAVYTTGDGDRHVDLLVDERFRRTPNAENVRQNHGWLVTETVPADRATVWTPRRGDHVAVTGPLVIDLAHGWAEIHPVWRITRD